MVRIVPTIFAKSQKEFDDRYKRLLPIAKEFQIDFMDGHFVPFRGPSLNGVPNLKRLSQQFEAHMMVKNPRLYVERAAQKGFGRFLFHIESQENPLRTSRLIDAIKDAGMQPGIVLNPQTPLARIREHISDVSTIMFMGHTPGYENAGIEKGVLQKIRQLRKEYPRLTIEVDGGVDEKTAPRFVAAGANRLSCGSYISTGNPKERLATLRRVVKK